MESEATSIFPSNLTIDLCKQATEGRREFRATVKDDLIVFNYDFCFDSTFPDPNSAPDPQTALLYKVRRECRGLIFNINTGKVVSRRLHKFFNIGEKDETHESKINWNVPFLVTEKLDGSLMSPVYTQGELRLASKNGPSDFSKRVESRFLNKSPQYTHFFQDLMERGYTPMFEWVSPYDPIVLQYEKDDMVFIAARNNDIGDYMSYKEMLSSASQYSIPTVKIWENDGNKSAREMLGEIKNHVDIEGCVLHFADGNMYKVKTEWYFAKHKATQAVPAIERDMWKLVLNQEQDDLKGRLTKELQGQLDEFANLLQTSVQQTAQRIEGEVNKLGHENGILVSKREFVEKVRNSVEPTLQSVYLGIFDGKDPYNTVKSFILKSCTPKDFEKCRNILGLQDVVYFKASE